MKISRFQNLSGLGTGLITKDAVTGDARKTPDAV
jgi:hypothetical protein